MSAYRLVGRSSSHYTRVARVFAEELGVDFEFAPMFDLASRDADVYAGNPALKLPILVTPDGPLFGTENICRELAAAAPARRVLWTESLPDLRARNAQELVWHAMAAQVQLVVGAQLAGLPTDNVFFGKAMLGYANALQWLDANVDAVLDSLPPHDLALLEVTLFCLLEHLAFRPTLPAPPGPRLLAFADRFRERPAARRTTFAFDVPPG